MMISENMIHTQKNGFQYSHRWLIGQNYWKGCLNNYNKYIKGTSKNDFKIYEWMGKSADKLKLFF